MIKFLISLFLILIVSCKEITNEPITNKFNDGIKKIENIIENKNEKNDTKLEYKKKPKDVIFYYLEEPYFIEGVKYIPEENYSYSEIGISTFYGKELHNTKTINNDINKVTELVGRHKTLPLPSMVKITNLDNGLSINIKIIDRHKDNASLIQVSRKVAQLLGFYKDKVATVRVDILSDATKQWKNVANSLNEPEFNETILSAPTSIVSISDIDNINTQNEKENLTDFKPIELVSEQVDDYKMFLIVYKFSNYNEVKSVMKNLNQDIKYTSEKNGTSYDIIIGPVDKTEINNLVSYFISKGYKDTKIVLN